MSNPSHVDVGLLFELAQSRLDPAQAERIQQHLANCGACSAEFALALENASLATESDSNERSLRLQREFAARLDNQERSSRRPRTTAPGRVARIQLSRALLVAALVVIGFGAVQWLRETGPRSDELGQNLRSQAQSRSVELSIQSLGDGTWELQWSAIEDLENLELRVVGTNGRLLLQRPLQGESLRLRSQEIGNPTDPSTLFAQIQGNDATGTVIRSSPQRLPR